MSSWEGVGTSWVSKVILCTLVIGFAFLPQALAVASPAPASASQFSTQGSWALGLVVPNGSPLSQGGKVNWSGVNNVTAVVQLPKMSETNGTTYAILSLMVSGGSILQLASALRPNASSWGTYAAFIQNPAAYPQRYTTLQDTPAPANAPGSTVSLSIYSSGDVWNYEIRNLATKETLHSTYNVTLSPSLGAGDQEVFALESYTYSASVFASMGNLTLATLALNGDRVSGGWYFYGGGWDPPHNPLFIVGGGTPPNFITAQSCGGFIACWGYTLEWSEGQGPILPPESTLAIIGTAIIVPIATASVAIFGCRRRHV